MTRFGTTVVGELFYARRLSRPEREDHAMPPLIGAALDNPAQYVGWGWLQISVPNLIVIIVMLVLFVLALVLPFPRDKHDGGEKS